MEENEEPLNTLEAAVLGQLALKYRELEGSIEKLKVSKREFTGVGSFTDFEPIEDDLGLGDKYLGLDECIIMIPTVPNGMGSVLFCKNGKPDMLELFTYGGDEWYGKDMNFILEPNP